MKVEGIELAKIYRKLTDFIPLFEKYEFGKWISDNKIDGTPEPPIQLSFVAYSKVVMDFIKEVYSFQKEHEEYHLNEYQRILEDNGVKWAIDSMTAADESSLDGQCVMALILGVIRADRFSEGTVLTFLKEGIITRWLERLSEIDDA